MYSNNSNGSGAASARGFVALCPVLAMGLGLLASPAAAAPFAYVANVSDTVSVIDTATNTVVATVPVGSSPFGVAVNPDGKHAYVTNPSYGMTLPPGTVAVIDTATNTVAMGTGFPILVGKNPAGVAVTPDGNHVYVANKNDCFFVRWCSGTVSVIDTATTPPSVTATVAVGSWPNGVAVTPDGTHAYVANTASATVSVIATATNTVVATVPVGIVPHGVAITPDGKHAYVTNYDDSTVSVIDTWTKRVGTPIPVGIGPSGIAITPDGKHAYVTNNDDSTVSVIDTASNMVVATFPVGVAPTGVAVTPDGKHAYVANRESNNVSVIDTASNTVEATVGVGSRPNGVGIVPAPPGVP